MYAFIGFLGLLLLLICFIWLIVSLIVKKPLKLPALFMTASFIMVIIALVLTPEVDEIAVDTDNDKPVIEDERDSVETDIEEPTEINDDLKEPVKGSAQDSESQIEYEVIYADEDGRVDDGTFYYILIDTVVINKPNFKDDIKQLINELVNNKGTGNSFDIYDDLTALEYGYTYDNAALDEFIELTEDETKMKILVRHGIATYHGDLTAMTYKNTLFFFSYYDQVLPIEESPVYHLQEVIEFNP